MEPPAAPTREFWVHSPERTGVGGYPPNLGLGQQCWLSFRVPHDYTSMISMILVLVPAANHVCNFTVQGAAGACGEGINTHWQNIAINQAVVANIHNCVDLVPLYNVLMPLLSAGDFMMNRLINNIATGSEIYGMAVRYS